MQLEWKELSFLASHCSPSSGSSQNSPFIFCLEACHTEPGPLLGNLGKLGALAWACGVCFGPTCSDAHDIKGRRESEQPWAVGSLPGARLQSTSIRRMDIASMVRPQPQLLRAPGPGQGLLLTLHLDTQAVTLFWAKSLLLGELESRGLSLGKHTFELKAACVFCVLPGGHAFPVRGP